MVFRHFLRAVGLVGLIRSPASHVNAHTMAASSASALKAIEDFDLIVSRFNDQQERNSLANALERTSSVRASVRASGFSPASSAGPLPFTFYCGSDAPTWRRSSVARATMVSMHKTVIPTPTITRAMPVFFAPCTNYRLSNCEAKFYE